MAKRKEDSSKISERYKKARGSMFTDTGAYIHSLKSSYVPILGAANAELQAMNEYKRNTQRFKKLAASNLKVPEDTALDIISEIAKVSTDELNKALGSSKTENPSGFKPLTSSSKIQSGKKSIELNEKSFQAIASSITISKKEGSKSVNYAQTILENGELLGEYIRAVEKVIEDYGDLKPEALASLAANSKSNELSLEAVKAIPRQGKGISIINGPTGTQKTSMENTIKGWMELRKYLDKTGSGYDEAEEVMRSMAGWFKGIGGQGMEVIAQAMYESAAFTASKGIQDALAKLGGKAQIVPSSTSSSDSVEYDPNLKNYSLLGTSSTTRKSDVNIRIQIQKEGGTFEVDFGASLKQKKLSPTRSKKFDVHTGSLKNFLIRTNSYFNTIEYDLLNSMVHGTSNYTSMKKLIAARGALEALTGVGAKGDMAYILVFSNKSISMYDYLNSIGEKTGGDKIGPLSVKLAGEKEFSGITRKKPHRRQDNVDSYIRSKNLSNLIYEKVKLEITGTIPKL